MYQWDVKAPLFLLPSPGWDIGSIILKMIDIVTQVQSLFLLHSLLWGAKLPH